MGLELLILFNSSYVASLGFGSALFVKDLMRKLVSGPDILIIATPEAPIPDDNAHIVINFIDLSLFMIFISV